ncbi:MAG: tetratricopeptide repeat protein [Deltaproteobacteria bacterium]|nr:tetratricopeptide repeat protein [Deltaproteobacteria bacterium]
MSRALKWIFCLLSILPVTSWAQGSDGAGRDEFVKANRFFEAGEYEAALPMYRKAYQLSNRRSSTIRALAQCERALKMYDEAITHFEEYLATEPEDAVQIRETVELLKDLRASQAKPDAPRDPGDPKAAPKTDPPVAKPADPPVEAIVAPAPRPAEPSLLESPVFWGVTGAAVVGVVLVVVLAASAGESDPTGGTTGVVLYR